MHTDIASVAELCTLHTHTLQTHPQIQMDILTHYNPFNVHFILHVDGSTSAKSLRSRLIGLPDVSSTLYSRHGFFLGKCGVIDVIEKTLDRVQLTAGYIVHTHTYTHTNTYIHVHAHSIFHTHTHAHTHSIFLRPLPGSVASRPSFAEPPGTKGRLP